MRFYSLHTCLFALILSLMANITATAQYKQRISFTVTENTSFYIPAITGANFYKELEFDATSQWTGNRAILQSFYGSFGSGIYKQDTKSNSPSYKISSYIEKLGLLNNFNFSGAYAYQFFLKENVKKGVQIIRFALGIEMNILSFDIGKLRPADAGDDTLVYYDNLSPDFDFNVSAFYHNKNAFFGIGFKNLRYEEKKAYLYYGKVLYNGIHSDIVPSIFIRYNQRSNQIDYDIRSKFILVEKMWGSIGLRRSSFTVGGGMIRGKLSFGYSLNYTFTEISERNKYNYSHSLYIGYIWSDRKVKCPIW